MLKSDVNFVEVFKFVNKLFLQFIFKKSKLFE